MKYLIIDDEHELYRSMFSDLFKPNQYSIEEVSRLVVPPKFNYLKKLHFNERINRHLWLPGKSIWNRYYALSNYKFDSEEEYVIIFLNGTLRHYYSFSYLENLKKKHSNIKLVMIMYDSFADKSAARAISMIPIFDLVFSFDVDDSQKYGFEYIYSTFSYPEFVEYDSHLKSKAFFIGNATGRLEVLQETLNYLGTTIEGTDFTIVGVPNDKKKYEDNIKYNKPICYKEQLQKSYNTDCIVEILKEGQTGITLRTCEAVMFNKKLLTNNASLKNMPFYDERFMEIFTNIEDIDLEFLTKEICVNYADNNFFSPLRIIDRIFEKHLF